MNEKTFQALEFERILSGVRSFCINADGKEQTQLLMPQSDYTEAKRLLAETDRSVTDIAGSLGFQEVKYFDAVFKKSTGMTPVKYRNKECHHEN